MIKLTHILRENESKKLRIFDFDDTLAISNSRIKVSGGDGKVFYLTPGEYAVYDARKGDTFDYSEFERLIDPKEIKAMTKVLRAFYNSRGKRRLTILTARGSKAKSAIADFMKKIGIPNIEIVTVDSSDPKKKADWIEDKIKQGYNDVFFADDSEKNVRAVSSLKTKYPSVRWEIRLAKYR